MGRQGGGVKGNRVCEVVLDSSPLKLQERDALVEAVHKYRKQVWMHTRGRMMGRMQGISDMGFEEKEAPSDPAHRTLLFPEVWQQQGAACKHRHRRCSLQPVC